MNPAHLDEVNQIVEAALQAGLSLRLTGSWAVYFHCPEHRTLMVAFGRTYRDADFVAYTRDNKRVSSLMAASGYVEDRHIFIASEGGRAIFHHPTTGFHVDVFYGKLDFCHTIPFDGRLEADPPTIMLAELLLSKMQIFHINEKDLMDTILLLLEHPIGDQDAETINATRIAKLCAADWGLWRTVTMNLDKTQQIVHKYAQLNSTQKGLVSERITVLRTRIDGEPKSIPWRLRAQVGERIKWYKHVDEVE